MYYEPFNAHFLKLKTQDSVLHCLKKLKINLVQCVNYPCVIGGELIGDCQFQLPDFSPKQPNFREKLTIQIHI